MNKRLFVAAFVTTLSSMFITASTTDYAQVPVDAIALLKDVQQIGEDALRLCNDLKMGECAQLQAIFDSIQGATTLTQEEIENILKYSNAITQTYNALEPLVQNTTPILENIEQNFLNSTKK